MEESQPTAGADLQAVSLVMPEYGRNVQSMVEYALTITDKAERTQCVRAIMQTMGNLFPYLRNQESRHKMYDHLAIMSNFRLDIDFPYHRPQPETLSYTPQPLPYNTGKPIRFRHYGRIVEIMIEEAIKEQDIECRQRMIVRIASRMKYNFFLWNKDNVDDEQIKQDIAELSNGQLSCDFEGFRLRYRPYNPNPYKQDFRRQNWNNNNNNRRNNTYQHKNHNSYNTRQQ